MIRIGEKIRKMRENAGLTREEICGDEDILSVRQLARIEKDQSNPSLINVAYIAKQLKIGIDDLINEENLELPHRYKELKYLILRTPTYLGKDRIKQQEKQFDEIAMKFYEDLPEEEQLAIDCLQAAIDVKMSMNTDFGVGLLHEYFERVKTKLIYSVNDLIIVNLYLTCVQVSNFSSSIYDDDFFDRLTVNTLRQSKKTSLEDLFVVTNILLLICSINLVLEKFDYMEEVLETIQDNMHKVHDFQKAPVANLLEWKYRLKFMKDKEKALGCYEQAMVFANMFGDKLLVERLSSEWERDCQANE